MPDVRRIRVKVCLVGSCGVGKSSLIRRLVKDEFDERYIPTPNTAVSKVEFIFPHDQTEVAMEIDIWDITGQKGIRQFLEKDYFRSSRGIIAVFDATRDHTLEELDEWISSGISIAGDVPTLTLINKMDLKSGGHYSNPAIKVLCQKFNSPFFLVSAKTGMNVEEAFQQIAQRLYKDAVGDLEGIEGDWRVEYEIMRVIAKRGKLGAPKAFFFQNMRGVAFDMLESHLEDLEEKGFIRVSWSSSTDFVAFLTDVGWERVKLGQEGIEWDAVDMVA